MFPNEFTFLFTLLITENKRDMVNRVKAMEPKKNNNKLKSKSNNKIVF